MEGCIAGGIGRFYDKSAVWGNEFIAAIPAAVMDNMCVSINAYGNSPNVFLLFFGPFIPLALVAAF